MEHSRALLCRGQERAVEFWMLGDIIGGLRFNSALTGRKSALPGMFARARRRCARGAGPSSGMILLPGTPQPSPATPCASGWLARPCRIPQIPRIFAAQRASCREAQPFADLLFPRRDVSMRTPRGSLGSPGGWSRPRGGKIGLVRTLTRHLARFPPRVQPPCSTPSASRTRRPGN